MTKRKPLEKVEARARRDQLMETAMHAKLSVTDGVREMRAISGLTQDQFAEHRGISTRVVKALELGKANPTVGTLNRIAEFYGLEVGFVPSKHLRTMEPPAPDDLSALQEAALEFQRTMDEILSRIDRQNFLVEQARNADSMRRQPEPANDATAPQVDRRAAGPGVKKARVRKK